MPISASICIPTLTAKRLPYLKEAVRSARAQTRKDIEILVRNDGTDGAIRDFVRSENADDPRVTYAENPSRLGLGGNWNALTEAARGEYLMIIGDDDRLLPTFVEASLAAARHDTSVVFSNHHVIDAEGARDVRLTKFFCHHFGRDALPPGPVTNPAAVVWRNSVPMSASLIRSADAKRLGIKADLNTPEIELFARLAAEGKGFVFVPEYLVEYRVHRASATAHGLMGERLIRYLDPVPVPADVEPCKRTFMQTLVVGAVNKALREGSTSEARAWLRHRYYPSARGRLVEELVQQTLSRLPSAATIRSFRALQAARRFAQSLRRSGDDLGT